MTVRVITWRWGNKYAPHYTERLAKGVARNLTDYTFTVCEPLEQDMYLTEIQGCFARLRTFDPDWQNGMGFKPGDKILCLDLDLIVTGDLAPIVNRPEPFVIAQGMNASNPCPMNGSVWMLEAGYRPDVWADFSVEAASKVPFFIFPEDQAWFAHKMPDAAAYTVKDGVYGMGKPGWPKGTALPSNARIVAFPGHRDPSDFTHLDWVKRHWQ